MPVEKVILIFALFGSAIKVIELIAAMIGSAIAKTDSTKNTALAVPVKIQTPPLANDPLARLTALMEAQALAVDEMKDQTAYLIRRLEVLESGVGVLKGQSQTPKPVRPRATRAKDQMANGAQAPQSAPQPVVASQEHHVQSVSHSDVDEARFELVQH